MAYSRVGQDPILVKDGVAYDLQYNPTNGNVQIIRRDAIPVVTQPIYFDGRFTPAANELNLNEVEQKNLHNRVQSEIRAAHSRFGGTNKGARLPEWAKQENQGANPGETKFAPSSVPDPNNPIGNTLGSIRAIAGAVINPSQAIQNISVLNKDYSVGNEGIFKEFALKYPTDMRIEKQDHLIISQYEYIPPNAKSIFTGSENIWNKGLTRNTDFNKEKLVGEVFLPMPNTVADSNSVFWEQDYLNNLTAGAAANVMDNMGGYLLAAGGGGATAAAMGGNPGGGAALGVRLMGLAALISSGAYANNESLQALFGADAVQMILSMQGKGIEPETILARGAGVIPNSNMEFLFKGVTLRTFDNFNWRMTARSPEEAKVIRRIIRFFKQGMAARKETGKSGAPSFMLGTPNIFRLLYKSGKEPIDALNKFKTCALTRFSTDYTPDRFWASYDKGQPLSIAISMSFTELEPIYNTDYQEGNIFDGRDDLDSITPNMVGY